MSIYDNYYGHTLEDLEKILILSNKPKIYLVGDSILDNKFWVKNEKVNKIRNMFDVPDIAYHINNINQDYLCINCACEEAKVENKNISYHDQFVIDHICEDDILVISIGGNDFMLNKDNLTKLEQAQLERIMLGYYGGPKYKDLLNIFNDEITKYILLLIQKRKPKQIIYLFPYFPCEIKGKCWSSVIDIIMMFKEFLKDIMKAIYNDLHFNLDFIYDTIPLFEILNSKKNEDYIQRLEPSSIGGMKIAKSMLLKLKNPPKKSLDS